MSTPLDQTQKAYTAWRSTRSQRGSTPQSLIAQTVALLPQHKKSEITRRLGINHDTLIRWIKEHNEGNTFVELPMATVNLPVSSTPTNHSTLSIKIHFTHGAQLTLAGTESQAAALISELFQRGAL